MFFLSLNRWIIKFVSLLGNNWNFVASWESRKNKKKNRKAIWCKQNFLYISFNFKDYKITCNIRKQQHEKSSSQWNAQSFIWRKRSFRKRNRKLLVSFSSSFNFILFRESLLRLLIVCHKRCILLASQIFWRKNEIQEGKQFKSDEEWKEGRWVWASRKRESEIFEGDSNQMKSNGEEETWHEREEEDTRLKLTVFPE